MDSFDLFLERHPLYAEACEKLAAEDSRLLLSAGVVYELHGETLGPVADEILAYVRHRFADTNPFRAYAARVRQLAALQSRFDADPTVENLGDARLCVDSDVYALGLLLSTVLTNHRFEIRQRVCEFLEQRSGRAGRLASIGTGTGYELKLAAERLPAWTLESYDINPRSAVEARALLSYFHLTTPVGFGGWFPLDRAGPSCAGRYDAILLVEVLEHLSGPEQALRTLGACLAPGGRLFVTMAVNIAQEDHVFLYPTIAGCREQIARAGGTVETEWITPQTTLPPPPDREASFRKGNYVAALKFGE